MHTGDFLGTATRVVWVFIGLSPLVLGTTGITMNLVRRSKRAKAAAVRPNAPTDLAAADGHGGGARRRGGTVAGLNETLLRELFATPPPDFVAARNEVVKALRKDKARDDATAVAALRRPGWDEWSLNAVATSDPDVVAGFVDAAAQVRDAQAAAIEGRDGPDIRTALRDLRDRSADLVRLADAALAGAGRQAAAGEINARLSKVAASDVAGAQLIAGILGSGDAAPNELFADLQPAPSRPKPTKAEGEGRQGDEGEGHGEGDRDGDDETTETKPSAAEERAAHAEAARRKEALVEANRLHAAAVKARHRAEAARDKATAALERAQAALAEAESGAADRPARARRQRSPPRRPPAPRWTTARAAVEGDDQP